MADHARPAAGARSSPPETQCDQRRAVDLAGGGERQLRRRGTTAGAACAPCQRRPGGRAGRGSVVRRRRSSTTASDRAQRRRGGRRARRPRRSPRPAAAASTSATVTVSPPVVTASSRPSTVSRPSASTPRSPTVREAVGVAAQGAGRSVVPRADEGRAHPDLARRAPRPRRRGRAAGRRRARPRPRTTAPRRRSSGAPHAGLDRPVAQAGGEPVTGDDDGDRRPASVEVPVQQRPASGGRAWRRAGPSTSAAPDQVACTAAKRFMVAASGPGTQTARAAVEPGQRRDGSERGHPGLRGAHHRARAPRTCRTCGGRPVARGVRGEEARRRGRRRRRRPGRAQTAGASTARRLALARCGGRADPGRPHARRARRGRRRPP